MKNHISPLATLLAAASLIDAAAANTDASSQQSRLLSLEEIAASLQNSGNKLGVESWTDSFQCTADLTSGSAVDQSSCATTKDAKGAACIWCDATAVVGTGLCVSPDIQSMTGQFWDQLCAADDGGGSDAPGVAPPPPPVPATPGPTPPPTPPPVEPAPVPVPDDDNDNGGGGGNDNIPDALKCSLDSSSNLITDESTCAAMTDSTSTTGEKCVWCSVPIIGGSCVTNSVHSTVHFLCSGGGDEGKAGGKYLRGDVGGGGGAWKALDPSCLGDGLAGGTRESCAAKTDSSGEACVWCDAGEGAFGICAAPSQEGYLDSYMDCADAASPVAAAE